MPPLRSIALLLACTVAAMETMAADGAASAAGPLTIMPTDPGIAYTGRWESAGGSAVSAWNGAYFRTRFTGRSFRAELDGSVDLCVIVDGNETILTGVHGIVDLLEGHPPLSDQVHDLTVAACWDHDRIRLRRLGIDPGATLSPPPLRPRLIEFIGASSISATGTAPIYHCTAGYAWLTGERLGAEHRTISFSGKTLQDRPSYAAPMGTGSLPSAKAGLESLFFKNQPIDAHPGPAGFRDWQRWGDAGHPPADVVVCQLGGSNDAATTITPEEFAGRVVAFVRRLRAVYPAAHVLLLTPWYTFNDRSRALVTALSDAATALRQGDDGHAPDGRIACIDATGWLALGSDDFCSDKGHPSNLGHRKAAMRLSEAISRLTGIPLPPEGRPVTSLDGDRVAIDDADDRFVWLGCYQPSNEGWRTVRSQDSYRGGYHLSVSVVASFTHTFTGTFACIHGPVLPECSGDVLVTIRTQSDDGSWTQQQGTFSQCGTDPRPAQLLYQTPPLRLSKNGRHTISLQARDGRPMALDRLEIGSR